VFARVWHDAKTHDMTAESFRPIATTDPMPLDAYCVSGKMDRRQADVLQDALLALDPHSETAKRAITGDEVRFIGFVPAADADYDGVRENLRISAQDEPDSTRVISPPRRTGPIGPEP
jgi:ABC-type phosphate/phosphonate transport system substrate-binding protein